MLTKRDLLQQIKQLQQDYDQLKIQLNVLCSDLEVTIGTKKEKQILPAYPGNYSPNVGMTYSYETVEVDVPIKLSIITIIKELIQSGIIQVEITPAKPEERTWTMRGKDENQNV
jgi:hypothetical protein